MIKQILAYLDDVCRQESGNSTSSKTTNGYADDNISITFDNFCIIESYLSVLQQEILETSCVSPIKGTNLQQPPIYLTDFQGWSRRVLPSPISTGKHFSLEATISRNHQSSNSYDFKDTVKNKNNTSEASRENTASSNTSDVAVSNAPAKGYLSAIGQNHIGKDFFLRLQENESPLKAVTPEQNDSTFSSSDSENDGLKTRDLYLGGSCWLLSNWQQNYAVPYLKSKNITFYTSSLHEGPVKSFNLHETGEIRITANDQLVFDPAILDASRILLFVIGDQTRSLGAMTMAAHYMGLGYNIVLCVQMLPNECRINGTQLSSSAIKDYNRGRAYLIDLAKRQNIPVYSNIEDALESAIEKLNCTR
nr:uncharacterized protein LOC109403689 isoform X2 [Aedes albopictus]